MKIMLQKAQGCCNERSRDRISLHYQYNATRVPVPTLILEM